MENRSPHYDLGAVQLAVRKLGVAAFTKTALDGGRELGLTSNDMLQVMAALTRFNFYKSMTSYSDHSIWQDVYHAMTPVGKLAYIKVTYRASALVIQFKEK